MSTTKESAEALALRGLLLLVIEIQNAVTRTDDDGAADPLHICCEVADLVESAHCRELVQLARAALEAPPSRKVFFGIVTEQDLPKDRPQRHDETPRGPIMMECYLDGVARDRGETESFAKRMGFDRYGWVRVAEIHVDIPATPAAIPAAVAGVHT